MREHQIGRNEGGEDRARTDLVEIRNPLADLRAGKAAHRQQRDVHQNVGRNLAGSNKAGGERCKDREHRQRHDTDIAVHDAPPGAKDGRRIFFIAQH